MEDFVDSKNLNNYQKEQKLKDRLKEEIIILTQNNLSTSVKKFQEFTDIACNIAFNKRVPLIKDYCGKNSKSEESKKIAEERVVEENDKMNEANADIKRNIKIELEDVYNADIQELHNGIDEIFNTSNINRNIKSIYNSIKNNDYSNEKIKENLKNSIKKYEETFRKYLLKKMKYKEELEIQNLRQQQIINENIDSKKDYADINNYLNNFKIDVKANNDYKKLTNLAQSLKDYNLNNIK